MIEIKMTGMCEGCKYADLSIIWDENRSGRTWEIACRHQKACKRMEVKNGIDRSFDDLEKEEAQAFKLGDRIKKRLDEIGMSQRELAQAVKITEVSMSRYINNDRTPKGPLISKMAKELGVSCDYLLGGIE